MRNKRLYNIWSCMKQRCNNPNHTAAKWYHDKGIEICSEWLDFDVFQEWALKNGYADDLSIDRKDSDKNYCPDNCHWIPLRENILKRRNSHGRSKTDFRYEVFECERWGDLKGRRIRSVGRFSHKEDARQKIKKEIAILRELSIKEAIESNQKECYIRALKNRESWLKYKYVIGRI